MRLAVSGEFSVGGSGGVAHLYRILAQGVQLHVCRVCRVKEDRDGVLLESIFRSHTREMARRRLRELVLYGPAPADDDDT